MPFLQSVGTVILITLGALIAILGFTSIGQALRQRGGWSAAGLMAAGLFGVGFGAAVIYAGMHWL